MYQFEAKFKPRDNVKWIGKEHQEWEEGEVRCVFIHDRITKDKYERIYEIFWKNGTADGFATADEEALELIE